MIDGVVVLWLCSQVLNTDRGIGISYTLRFLLDISSCWMLDIERLFLVSMSWHVPHRISVVCLAVVFSFPILCVRANIVLFPSPYPVGKSCNRTAIHLGDAFLFRILSLVRVPYISGTVSYPLPIFCQAAVCSAL
jgi:hypothetical protein